MDTTKNQGEILALENNFWQAMKEKDIEACLKLIDSACIVTGAQGAVAIDHNIFRRMMGNTASRLEKYELKDPTFLFPSDGVAVIAYRIREELSVEGKPLVLEAADASTWIRRDGKWLCALHTESILGDPFGRDRNG